jgi:hypothetical protein
MPTPVLYQIGPLASSNLGLPKNIDQIASSEPIAAYLPESRTAAPNF